MESALQCIAERESLEGSKDSAERKALYQRSKLLRLVCPVSPEDPLFLPLLPFQAIVSPKKIRTGYYAPTVRDAAALLYLIGNLSYAETGLEEYVETKLADRLLDMEDKGLESDPFVVATNELELEQMLGLEMGMIRDYRTIDDETLLHLTVILGEDKKAAWIIDHIPQLLLEVDREKKLVFQYVAARSRAGRDTLLIHIYNAMKANPELASKLMARDIILSDGEGIKCLAAIQRDPSIFSPSSAIFEDAFRELELSGEALELGKKRSGEYCLAKSGVTAVRQADGTLIMAEKVILAQ
jgi:hypothetical protein